MRKVLSITRLLTPFGEFRLSFGLAAKEKGSSTGYYMEAQYIENKTVSEEDFEKVLLPAYLRYISSDLA